MLSIIIIGAGAAGLQAGRRLAAAGHRVAVLEAGTGPGGRIMGLTPKGFSVPVEGGAEFIHGELPLSLAIAKEAGIRLIPVSAQMTDKGADRAGIDDVDDGEGIDRVGDAGGIDDVRDVGGIDGAGDAEGNDPADGGWDRLLAEMGRLTDDMPMAGFLAARFDGDQWAGLRQNVRRFAEGYDLADLQKVSTKWLYREWSNEGEEPEFRPEGGYGRLVDFLVESCRQHGAELHYSTPVEELVWAQGKVEAHTRGGGVFRADKVIVTVSLGVLEKKLLRFSPALSSLDEELPRLGYGSVIKILLQFKRPFWLKQKPAGKTLFVLSRQAVPTWWTQAEDENPVLTGWLAGQRMKAFRQLGEEGRLESCLASLAGIFSVDPGELRRELQASLVLDWAEMPFILGGYSYDAVGASAARARLCRPVADTIYFCGEAFYEGDSPGTVEAALRSGEDVAAKIIHDGQDHP